MKTILSITAAICAGALCLNISLADDKDHKHDHDHDHGKITTGPSGGRVLHGVEPHLEFFVTKDRKVKIIAVNDDLKPIALASQSVNVIGGDRSNPTRLKFAKEGNALISDKAFPKGNNFPVVVQIKNDSKSKTVLEKFTLNLSDCPTCDFKEYACACDHHDHDHKHDKKKKG